MSQESVPEFPGTATPPKPPTADPPTSSVPTSSRVRARFARFGGPRTDTNPVLEPLLSTVRSAHPKADLSIIERAYAVAETAHRGQLRKSGDPYITHPLAVTSILAELGMTPDTLAAALLHDTVEDTPYSLESMTRDFGDEIAMLVDGVTKLDKVTYGEAAQAETVRKMVVAMARDIRVLVIKLADRLHNARTWRYVSEASAQRKARETLEIYAPLAHRLGMNTIKWELEALSFATLYPKVYDEIVRLVAERAPAREEYLASVRENITKDLAATRIKAVVTGRPKHYYSVYQKMIVRGREFEEIYDLVAVRVLVESVRDCYAVLGALHARWNPVPGRFKDYIAMPKFNMYQSLHTTVIGPQGKPLEIQIRTYDMNETAQFGIAAHWTYKERSEDGQSSETEKLQWLRQMMEWQSEAKDASEFMESLRVDLFHDEVYVFTPNGEVKSLPADSTPVDFAYQIHTDVGNRCVGAKANGRIVPLTYPLQSGDIIEILTSKTPQGPSRDWLNFVQSSKARNKIRQWFKRERREDSEHLGKESLMDALRKQGLPAQRIMGSETLIEVIKAMNFQKREDFFVSLGTGKTSAREVLTELMRHLDKSAEDAKPDVAESKLEAGIVAPGRPSTGDVGITVDGMDGVAVRIPQCCRPVPGDDVVGYISLGKGVTVHRRDCPNVKSLSKNPERFADVTWEARPSAPFRVEIQVEGHDRSHLLEDISRTLSECGVNIVGAQVQTTGDNVVKNRFVFEVPEIDYMETVLQRLRRIDTVYDAYRVTPH